MAVCHVKGFPHNWADSSWAASLSRAVCTWWPHSPVPNPRRLSQGCCDRKCDNELTPTCEKGADPAMLGMSWGALEVLHQCTIPKVLGFSGWRRQLEITVQMHPPRKELAELHGEACKVLGSVAQSRKYFGMAVLCFSHCFLREKKWCFYTKIYRCTVFLPEFAFVWSTFLGFSTKPI